MGSRRDDLRSSSSERQWGRNSMEARISSLSRSHSTVGFLLQGVLTTVGEKWRETSQVPWLGNEQVLLSLFRHIASVHLFVCFSSMGSSFSPVSLSLSPLPLECFQFVSLQRVLFEKQESFLRCFCLVDSCCTKSLVCLHSLVFCVLVLAFVSIFLSIEVFSSISPPLIIEKSKNCDRTEDLAVRINIGNVIIGLHIPQTTASHHQILLLTLTENDLNDIFISVVVQRLHRIFDDQWQIFRQLNGSLRTVLILTIDWLMDDVFEHFLHFVCIEWPRRSRCHSVRRMKKRHTIGIVHQRIEQINWEQWLNNEKLSRVQGAFDSTTHSSENRSLSSLFPNEEEEQRTRPARSSCHLRSVLTRLRIRRSVERPSPLCLVCIQVIETVDWASSSLFCGSVADIISRDVSLSEMKSNNIVAELMQLDLIATTHGLIINDLCEHSLLCSLFSVKNAFLRTSVILDSQSELQHIKHSMNWTEQHHLIAHRPVTWYARCFYVASQDSLNTDHQRVLLLAESQRTAPKFIFMATTKKRRDALIDTSFSFEFIQEKEKKEKRDTD